ncbi:hypothetical protein [Lentibacillus sp. Marseille-P4043]|uniref:hypothetical protein n=1 Tax=Lentibacillus sp. Marseille-P4043 TaxID=2040293 RepID=UPI001F4849B8|nr:hypothetical protein [Lentibacillus sp. Marseille-P4043]
MRWSKVRENVPNRIVIVEAFNTTSENKVRTINEMAVISDFYENMDAWRVYKKIHKQNPEKGLYIFHTSNENAEVIEQFLQE